MRIQVKILLFLIGTVLLTGCKTPPVEEKVIDFISIDYMTVNESYNMGFFSIDEVEIFVYYMDMSYGKVTLDDTFVSSQDLAKVDVEGKHTILVNYNGFHTTFVVNVINNGLFEVSFESNGGPEVDSSMVYFGHKVEEPEEPILEGYTFEGWYLGDYKWNFLSRHVTNDITLSERWTLNTYKITVMEDAFIELTTIVGEHGETVNFDTVPTRNGLTFEGWYLDDETFETPIAFPVVLESDLTVYAKWTENPLRVFNWNIGTAPTTLDSGLNDTMDAGDVINNIFEGLVREKNGVVFPGMAESWNVSADGLTVTFNIREDAKWSDGSSITADDFVRSWLRAMDPNTLSEMSWIWEYTNIVGAMEYTNSNTDYPTILEAQKNAVGIESQDDGATFVVHLTKPTDYFVSFMSHYSFMPVPEHATTIGEGAWAKNPETAISNGPFKLVEYNFGESLVLEKNDEYWNVNEVNIDVINGYFIDEVTEAYVMYYNDELDFLPSVPSAEVSRLSITSPEFHVFSTLGTYSINFNLSGCEVGGTRDIGARNNTIFCNENLRKALSLSINREEITETLELAHVPVGGLLPTGFLDYNNEDFYHNSTIYSEIQTSDGTYSLAIAYFEAAANELFPSLTTIKAVLLLQATLETKSYHFNTSAEHLLVAQLIQSMWEENLGFTIELTNEEWVSFQNTREAGDFDLINDELLSIYMDPQSLLDIFRQGNYYNVSDYSNEAFELKMTEAETATTSLEHYTALYEAYEIFMDDMPVIPIYHYSEYYFVSERLTGWSRSVLGAIDFSTATIEH